MLAHEHAEKVKEIKQVVQIETDKIDIQQTVGRSQLLKRSL